MSKRKKTQAPLRGGKERGSIRSQKFFPSQSVIGFWFILPLLILLIVFLLYPIISSLWLSFHQWDGVKPQVWTGLANYITALTKDGIFREVLGVSLKIVLLAPLIMFVVCFGLAYLLYTLRSDRAKQFFQTVLFIPVILPMAVVAVLWRYFYSPDFGLINMLLKAVGLGGMARFWLSDMDVALYSVLVVFIWKGYGFGLVLYLAALHRIPLTLIEAARIDGASEFQVLSRIILPLVKPITELLLVLWIISSLRFFDLSYIMTRGGPGISTTTVPLYIWRNAFFYWKFGYASALAFILFAIILVAVVIVRRLLHSKGVEY